MDLKEYKAKWHRDNRDKILVKKKAYYEANRERLLAGRRERGYDAEYQRTPRGKFNSQKMKSIARGIPWELTFDEWWKIWQDSGKWEERGSGKYMMCRTRDEGPYAIGNVRIDDATGNIQERFAINGINKDN